MALIEHTACMADRNAFYSIKHTALFPDGKMRMQNADDKMRKTKCGYDKKRIKKNIRKVWIVYQNQLNWAFNWSVSAWEFDKNLSQVRINSLLNIDIPCTDILTALPYQNCIIYYLSLSEKAYINNMTKIIQDWIHQKVKGFNRKPLLKYFCQWYVSWLFS